jgi:hypothetical protein
MYNLELLSAKEDVTFLRPIRPSISGSVLYELLFLRWFTGGGVSAKNKDGALNH